MEQDFNSKLDLLLRKDRLPFLTSHDEAKNRVLQRIAKTEKVIPLYQSKRFYSKLAIAASIAVIFVLSISFFGSNRIVNKGASPLSHTLPDGSNVVLSAGSEMIYNDMTWSLKRDLDFSGFGFFEVKEGSNFRVNTDRGIVSVLGTSFSVFSNDERLKVFCKTGKVKVEDTSANFSILTPGNGIELNLDASKAHRLAPRYVDAWVIGQYRFENVKIEEVFLSIEDATGFDIVYPEELNSSYSGEFNGSQELEEILDIVCHPVGLSYEVDYQQKRIQIIK